MCRGQRLVPMEPDSVGCELSRGGRERCRFRLHRGGRGRDKWVEFALIDSAAGSVEELAFGPEVVERSKVHVASRECSLALRIKNPSRWRCEHRCFKERGRAFREWFDLPVSFEFVAGSGAGQTELSVGPPFVERHGDGTDLGDPRHVDPRFRSRWLCELGLGHQ